MFRPKCRDIIMVIFEKVQYTIPNAFICGLHLFKEQPADGLIIGPKYLTVIIIK